MTAPTDLTDVLGKNIYHTLSINKMIALQLVILIHPNYVETKFSVTSGDQERLFSTFEQAADAYTAAIDARNEKENREKTLRQFAGRHFPDASPYGVLLKLNNNPELLEEFLKLLSKSLTPERNLI